MSALFSPLKLRGVECRNRVFVSPMCQYSCRDGLPSEEHPLALDVRSTNDTYEVEAALPGMKPEDVNISVLGDTLSITGSMKDEQSGDDQGYTYHEIRRGSFSRTVTLPTMVKADAATATFEEGMLHLSIPKAEEAKPRQIQIKAAETLHGDGSEAR